MSRILSQSGNVIAADFGRRHTTSDLHFKAQLLYCDTHVMLLRVTYSLGGQIIATQHVTAAL